jgi:hypothetical protein
LGELFGIERFGQKKHTLIGFIAGVERFREIAGDKNDFRARPQFAQPIGKD